MLVPLIPVHMTTVRKQTLISDLFSSEHSTVRIKIKDYHNKIYSRDHVPELETSQQWL